ncbi:MAG: TIM44-like domain-containing protein, partial [Bacteroidetes bacterium]|nr:TIM44-like domain-containing protein [Bacteroidota bacterium]
MKKFVRFSLQNIGAITGPLLIILLLCISDDLHARVGGGGGSSSGGGDGDILGLAIYILYMIPFPWNLVVLAVIILLFILARKKARQQTILNRLPTGHGIKKARGYENFMAGNPAFNEEEFKKNVGDSFVQIQEAWQNKDMSKVRKYISDGMYQRLNTQFKMMKLLDQKNVIENLKVKNVYIDKVQSDGSYDIIHVAIHAAITDRFVSEKYSSLNQTFHEEFVEYWSFIKKRGADDKDLWHTNNCPNCGGELSKDGGEVCKCPSCGVMTNNPEFGWVLSEITQADDYITADPMVVKTENLKDKIKEMIHDNDDFSVQLIEDKASNGYLQVETARVMNDPKIM